MKNNNTTLEECTFINNSSKIIFDEEKNEKDKEDKLYLDELFSDIDY